MIGAVSKMSTFWIDRGHDGPARRGHLRIGNFEIQTPALVGPSEAGSHPFPYVTLGRDRTSAQPSLIAIPDQRENDLSPLHDGHLYLLPSMLSGGVLENTSDASLLSEQLAFLKANSDTVNASQAVVRIHPFTDPEALPSKLETFGSLGVRVAAFTFDGNLGPADSRNAILRSRIPRNWMALALGRISPHLIAPLHYLGFDLFDTGRAFEAAAQRTRLMYLDAEQITEDTEPRYCSCHACSKQTSLNALEFDALQDTLLRHNIGFYSMALSESTHLLKKNQLRWKVESLTHSSPAAASFIRKIDKALYSYLEEYTPNNGLQTMDLIGPESYYAPAIHRFRDNLVERFTPPSHKRLVLLLPCSARKPYSSSKSHKRFIQTIESTVGSLKHRIAETILTSPLGVIPRELERVFPAAHYDIPVTGDWDTEEIEIAATALERHMSKFGDDVVVIAHVAGGYLDIVRAAEERIRQSIIYTSPDTSVTKKESLNALGDVLLDMIEVLEVRDEKRTELEDHLRAIADFQFGRDAGHHLIPTDAKLGGKLYHTVTCRVNGEQICAFVASIGSISLTLTGGRLLQPLNRYWVRFAGRELKGSSIFAVGIEDADSRIRPGDEVIVLSQDDEVIGVGRSEMSGKEMCEFEKGHAISLRHKVEAAK
ncbi:MAG: hypothetical protein EAX95_08080 [Candidatus Thorarchaeota archaeon]|nr:hypothetical protein [Candidatus Thorarchaeota archaeon]